MTTKESAIKWWNDLSNEFDDNSKFYMLSKAINDFKIKSLNYRTVESLTGREIEEIWRKETQQKLEHGITITNVDSQVDFELIQEMMNNIENSNLCGHWVDNLQLFFNLLSTKPTFGKVAYIELSKLNI